MMAVTKADQQAASARGDERRFREPFARNRSSTGVQKPEDRAAHALEYIAAQLGMIRERLEK